MGGRPAKAAAVSSGKIGKGAKETRLKAEAALRGDSDKLTPPDWFNDRQREVFRYVVSEMESGGVLGNVDIFILTQFSVAVERLEGIERSINEDASLLNEKSLMTAKSKYTDDFKAGLRELSLSPQARAKLGGMAAAQKKEEADPVLSLINGKKKISSA